VSACAVVGAGFAGLAAADALAANGHDVTVFEARDRVGGRVHSKTLDNGATIELGAEFILPGHDVLRATAGRLSLPLYEKGTRYGDREPRPPVPREELLQAVVRLRDAREGTVATALEGLRLPPAVRDALTARVEISTAYPASDQAASVLADSGTAFGDFASHGIAGGNQRLATALARDLRVNVSAAVRRVTWTEDGVRVHDVDFDACVIAAPASVMDAIEFDPPLPERKQHALDGVRYGDAAKLFLWLTAPAEPSATLAVPDRFWAYTQLAPDGSPLPVLAAFAGTRDGVDALTAQSVRTSAQISCSVTKRPCCRRGTTINGWGPRIRPARSSRRSRTRRSRSRWALSRSQASTPPVNGMR
jgi:glycine/D-amino acid oxidase-like deaminating enzyme